MDIGSIAAAAVANSQSQLASAVSANVIKSNAANDQAIASLIEQSVANLQSIEAQSPAGSALGAGVGVKVDRQV